MLANSGKITAGNFWKQSGFGRSDSEAAFQEFLKRIPSSTNLAGREQGLDEAQQLQLHQALQAQQATRSQQLNGSLSGGFSALSGSLGSLPEAGSLKVGGIPRVPSLDLLRQLVVTQQGMAGSPGAAPGAANQLRSALLGERC